MSPFVLPCRFELCVVNVFPFGGFLFFVFFPVTCNARSLISLVPTPMDSGRKLGVYMHRADAPVSDYCPIGVAKILTCIADIYLAQGIDHTRLTLVVDMQTLRLGHLARYPLGLLRRFFLYAWVSGNISHDPLLT